MSTTINMTPSELAQLWRQVNRQMRELFRSAVDGYDLPPMAYWVLRRVRKEPGITISQLARRLGTVKSHVSTIADQLVKRVLIEKRPDPHDQRVVKLYLTPEAKGQLESMGDRSEAIWAIVFEELPATQRDELGEFLRTLLVALERAQKKAKKE